MRASRRAVVIAAAVAVLAVAAFVLRHAIVRTVLQAALSAASGYHVRIGAEAIGTSHATFFDVHVAKNGDPVLDARRVDVDYALRDIFPGGEHRYGFASIAIQNPVLTITRHADGSLTFTRPGGSPAAAPGPTRAAVEPLYFTARIRGGTIRLVDLAPREADLRVQTIADVSIDASVKSDARTTARIDGVYLGRRTASAPEARYPLEERSVIDVPRGVAINRLTARELPVRGLLNFLVHTPVVQFADGVLDGVDVSAYALAPKPDDAFVYTLGGGAELRDGRLVVSALARPVRDLRGPVEIAGDTVAVPQLAADAAGIPFHGRGALFDLFGQPAFRIAIAADGDVRALRTLFAFSAKQPLSGAIHFETLLAATIANPLIRSTIAAPRIAYDRYPIDDLSGTIDYFNRSIVMNGVEARFGSIATSVGGRVLLGSSGDDLAFAVAARGPGNALPYTNVIAPASDVNAMVLLSEPPGEGFTARGTIGLDGPTAGTGTFAVDPKGVGEFGPFDFGNRAGASLAGGFELQRPISQSAGWLHARDFPLADARRAASGLPGVRVPSFPPIAGVLDGDFAGGGTPDAFGLAGTFQGRSLRVAGYDLGTGSVRLGGSLTDLRLGGIRIAGPLGNFAGDGAYDGATFGLEGRYDGTLPELAPFTGPVSGRGTVHADLRAALSGKRIVIQTGGADLAGASIRGVPIERIAGTLMVDGKTLRIVAADGDLGGGRAVAADTGGPFLLSAPDLSAAALRGAGLPLSRGRLAFFGRGDLRGAGPSFDGILTLDGGVADGYPISGGVDVGFRDATATVRDGVAALGRTYGSFSGSVGAIGTSGPGALAYDLTAGVPIGDIGELRRTLRLPVKYLDGSFSAQLRVRGHGARPRVAGNVVAPEGSYNGLDFSAAHAQIALTSSSLAARDGSVTVGSTHAAVDASLSVARDAFDVDVRSDAANLADFDDYFDEAETLDGRGRIAIDFANDGVTTRSNGRVAVTGLRYRRLPFGDTDATWSQRAGTIVAALSVAGTHGAVRANGSVVPGPGGPLTAFRTASVRAAATAQRIDLDTWLPAFGYHAPVLGQITASGTVAGRWPHLALAGDASLSGGKIDGLAVRSAHLRASGNGDRIAIADATADLGFASFGVTGSFGLARTDPLALTVQAQTPDLAGALAAVRPRGPTYPIGGAATADALVGGTFAKPHASVGFEVTGGHYASLAIPRVLGSVEYDRRTLTVNDAEATFAKGNVVLTGALPVSLQPLGVAPDAPLSFQLALGSLDLAPFAPFAPGPNAKLGGTADGRLEIEGTARAPRVVGTIGLAGGFYSSDYDRAGIAKANAQLSFSGTTVALEALHATVGGGSIDGSGRLDLPFPGAPLRGYAIALTAHGARVDTPFGRGTIDGNAQLQSSPRIPTLGGNLTLSNASIPFSALYRLAAESGGATAGGGPPFDLAFDLVAHAGRNVRVQSSIMDIGATGTLDITGTLAQPRIAGALTATPGSVFSTYNRAFRVEQALVRFDPSNGVDPYIELRAYAHVTNPDPDPTRNAVGSADITISADGPADEIASGQQPLTFSSNPPYSQEQIVGLLLDASVFGAVNFGQQQSTTNLRGAPPPENVLDPPGVTTYQAGVINFNEEAFSVLNGQLTQRFLAPVERVFTGLLNLTDLELTVDYGGGVGYQALKQIGYRDLYASFGQTLANPIRTTAGFTARPDAITSVSFSYFDQNGNPAITTSPYGNNPYSGLFGTRLQGIQPLSYRQGFTFSIVRKYP